MPEPCMQLICIRPTEKKAENECPAFLPVNNREIIYSPSVRKERRRPVLKKAAALLLSATMLTGLKGSIGVAGQALSDSGLSGVIISEEASASNMDTSGFCSIFSSLFQKYISAITLGSAVNNEHIEGKENSFPVSLIWNKNTLCYPANTPGGKALINTLTPSGSYEDGVHALTLQAQFGSGYDFWNGISVQNGTGISLDIEKYINRRITWISGAADPLVLIIHTHSCESFASGIYDLFETDYSDRCTDTDYNVVRVGTEIAQVLTANGIGVVHDTFLYDYPSYSGAYSRSLAATEEILGRYPSIKIVIDVHRDALNSSGSFKYKLISQEGVAQVMLLVGTDGGSVNHSNWEENFTLAVKLQQCMNEKYPLLARPVKLTQSSYNQQTAPGAFILEVGANGNTLSEAILAGSRFANCLTEVIKNSVE